MIKRRRTDERKSNRVLDDSVEQSSDNRILVPAKNEKLQMRKQTLNVADSDKITASTGRLGVFGLAAERANIEAARAELAKSAANRQRAAVHSRPQTLSSIAKTIAAGKEVQSDAAQEAARQVSHKRKRKNLAPTPTSGITATKVTTSADAPRQSNSAVASSKNKRCCKSDLQRCLRIGDWIEISRVSEDKLAEKNGGNRLLAQFDGQNFIDHQTETKYRSLSSWVKRRMVDLGLLSPSSNISGWDYVVMHREEADGTVSTKSLRVLVEQTKQKMQMMRRNMKEQYRKQPKSEFFGGSDMGQIAFASAPNALQLNRSATFELPTAISLNDTVSAQAQTQSLHSQLLKAREQVAELEKQLYTQ